MAISIGERVAIFAESTCGALGAGAGLVATILGAFPLLTAYPPLLVIGVVGLAIAIPIDLFLYRTTTKEITELHENQKKTEGNYNTKKNDFETQSLEFFYDIVRLKCLITDPHNPTSNYTASTELNNLLYLTEIENIVNQQKQDHLTPEQKNIVIRTKSFKQLKNDGHTDIITKLCTNFKTLRETEEGKHHGKKPNEDGFHSYDSIFSQPYIMLQKPLRLSPTHVGMSALSGLGVFGLVIFLGTLLTLPLSAPALTLIALGAGIVGTGIVMFHKTISRGRQKELEQKEKLIQETEDQQTILNGLQSETKKLIKKINNTNNTTPAPTGSTPAENNVKQPVHIRLHPQNNNTERDDHQKSKSNHPW